MLQLVDDETDPGVRSPLPTPPRRPSPSLRVSSPSSPLRPLPSSAPSARASSPLRPLSSLSFPTAFVGPPSPGEAEIRRAVVQGQDGGHREELTIPVRDYGGRVVALLQVHKITSCPWACSWREVRWRERGGCRRDRARLIIMARVCVLVCGCVVGVAQGVGIRRRDVVLQ